MAYKLTVFFNDGYQKSFAVEDDEDATLRRNDLLESGYQEKEANRHTFYPPHAVTKIIVTKE